MKMQKRIETDWYVLELKEPEKVEGVAIAVSVCCDEEEGCYKNSGGVLGKKVACLSAAETVLTAVLTATVRNLLDDGLSVGEAMMLVSKMCATATVRAEQDKGLKTYSALDENGVPIKDKDGELN